MQLITVRSLRIISRNIRITPSRRWRAADITATSISTIVPDASAAGSPGDTPGLLPLTSPKAMFFRFHVRQSTSWLHWGLCLAAALRSVVNVRRARVHAACLDQGRGYSGQHRQHAVAASSKRPGRGRIQFLRAAAFCARQMTHSDPKQAVRIRVFWMAAGSYLVGYLVLMVSYFLGVIGPKPLQYLILPFVIPNVAFYTLFRTGLNLKFK